MHTPRNNNNNNFKKRLKISEATRNSKSKKDRQYNGQKKKDK